GRDDLDVVATRAQERGHLRRMRGRTADVGRPDARDDEDLHAGAASGRGIRSRPSVQKAASTIDPASIPTAAPVAPYSAPTTSTPGTSTATSSAWPAVRMPGLPIETGKLFVHPNTNCTTATSNMTRNASVAGRYLAW